MVLTVPKNLSFLKMLEQSKYEKSRWAVVSVPSIGVSHLDDGLTRGGDLLAGWGSNPVPLSLRAWDVVVVARQGQQCAKQTLLRLRSHFTCI